MKLIKGNRHRVVDRDRKAEDLPEPAKVQGRSFATLMTIHKYECQ